MIAPFDDILELTPKGWKFRKTPRGLFLANVDAFGAAMGIPPRDRDGGAFLRARQGRATHADRDLILRRVVKMLATDPPERTLKAVRAEMAKVQDVEER